MTESLNSFIKNYADGNPRNIEACHIVQIGCAANDADDPDVKEYLLKLKKQVIDLWKSNFNEPCPTCGRR